MGTHSRSERAATFGVNAGDYDAVRPGYPPELFRLIESYAGLRPGARILEIGCGPGQATRLLADLDAAITCLEPSEALCALARERFADRPNVSVHQTPFESFRTDVSFDLILAATSFHWLDPETRLTRCAELLTAGGTLAIVAHEHPRPYTGFFAAVQACYDRHVPEWAEHSRPGPPPDAPPGDDRAEELRAHPRFTDVEVHARDWHVDFSAEAYGRLLHTYSDHILLGPERLAALVADVRQMIDDEYGGVVRRPYRSVLRLARRKEPSSWQRTTSD